MQDDKDLTSVRMKLTTFRDDLSRVQEQITSAATRLKILDNYGMSLDDPQRKVDIGEELKAYRIERERVFQNHMDATVRDRQLSETCAKLEAEEKRLTKLSDRKKKHPNKEKAKAQKAARKEAEKRQRRKAEAEKEKLRIKQERQSFWPRSCWSVRITLDAVNLTDTPASSRRSSIASASDVVRAVPESGPSSSSSDPASYTCDLSLCYVVSNAHWSPSYDLSLSTTSNTALLCFDAQLTNKTSENWSNCKIVLSTSQATFAGLQDAIPTLVPWRVRLGGRGRGAQSSILDSREERAEREGWKSRQNAWEAQKSRAHLYGVDTGFPPHRIAAAPRPPPISGLFGGVSKSVAVQSSSAALFGATSSAAPAPPPPGASLFGARSASTRGLESEGIPNARAGAVPESRNALVADDDDGATMTEAMPELSFQETAFEETGLTTTHDLPGLKTLNTSSTASKQRVARVSFAGVAFSHTVVAKYKPAAYLKAKLRNGSKLSLLKGPVGLTLDGSFMGRSTLPRCSAGDSFTLSLGVDPAIDVAYPAPDVKRASGGLFGKVESSVYTRSVTLTNTRAVAGKPIHLLVLDQVPVSEDERLRIAVAHPRGLVAGGASVATGVPGKEGKENAHWGTATAQLKKGGEVSWDVVLDAGRSVKLALEYEVAAPGGEGVVQV